MSLFTSFNTGVSGIRQAQSGLNTTAHNLSNADTKGYTRQQNINTDLYYRTIQINVNGAMRVGYGTTVSQIRQVRDMFLDKEYRVEFGRQSFYEKLADTEMEIEDLLGEMEGVEFRNNIQELWNTLQTFSTNPQEIVDSELFISKAGAFLAAAQDLYNGLITYQTSLNEEISDQVDTVNQLADKIAECNLIIAKSEANHVENANDYRDLRNQLMDELSKYVKYTYAEDVNGVVQIYVNNAPLVLEGRGYHMRCEKIQFTEYNEDTGKDEVVEGSPMYKIVWEGNGYGDVYDLDRPYSTDEVNSTDIGSLFGILTARGNKVAKYSDIPVAPDQEDFTVDGVLDETAYKVAMNKFRDELKDYNNSTGNSVITKIQAQFDRLINGIVTMINDVFCPNLDVQLDHAITGVDSEGNNVTLSGGCKVLDVWNCNVGTDDNETIGTEVFSRNQRTRYNVITLGQQVYGTDENGNQVPLAQEITNPDGTVTYKLYVYNEEDASDMDTMYTLMNMKINPKLEADYSFLPVKWNPATGNYGSYNWDTFKEMFSRWESEFAVLDPNTLTTYNFNDYYKTMVEELSIQGEVWIGMVERQTSMVENIEDQRQQVAGVSTEEELTSMLMYQHAYNASSRYISTINDMLEHLIERLG